MAAISELSPVVGVQDACAVLGLPRASYYRQQRPSSVHLRKQFRSAHSACRSVER